jgi:hypothetical protein
VPEDPAFINDVRSVGYRKRVSYVVVRDQHPDPGGFHVANYFLQVENRDGINSRKRLIQQDELGLDAQCSRDLNPSSLTTRKGISAVQANVLKSQLINQLFHGLAALVPGDRLGFQHGENILLNRELSENRGLLGEITDPELPCPLVHGHVRNLFLVYEDSARVGGYQADDRVESGRFTGAIRPQQTDNFSLRNADAHTVYNPAAAIRLTYSFGCQRLHLAYHSRLGDGTRTAVALHDDPITAPKQSQRNAGNLAAFGIKNARRAAG